MHEVSMAGLTPLGMGKIAPTTGPELQDDLNLPLRERVVRVLKTVYDPELPVDIYELGLIYEIDVREDQEVHVRMTLTSPACPVAGALPNEVKQRIASLPGVRSAQVELVWEPPWTKERMSEEARLVCGFF